jgi:hypothetical protein
MRSFLLCVDTKRQATRDEESLPGELSPSMRRPVGVNEFLFSYLWILTLSPSRLGRHPSIRSLC